MKSTRNHPRAPKLRALVAALRGSQGWLVGLASVPALLSPAAWAQSIQTDGRTLTTVTTAGAVTDVRTATISGNAGFNSFKSFSVNAGHTANLYVPDGALRLVNIVRDARTDINGTLNAIRDGRIGGNVYFANPHGFVVGRGGVVNVGSLSVSTPTQGFVDGFFGVSGMPDAGSLSQLLDNSAPLAAGGLIRIDGRINAAESVELAAGSVSVAGAVLTGARFEGRAPDFTDVVNAQGLAVGSRVVEREGRIFIAAADDIEVSGTLDARGGAGVDGGDITLHAGRDILLDIDATVTAAGDGAASDGGRIDSLAQRNALIRSGAVMDASAGSSGDGGFVEFSAKDTVELAGGQFFADGRGGGVAGSILIDPANIVVSANLLRGVSGYGTLPDGVAAAGADLTLQADDSITVNENIVISSRRVAGTSAAAHSDDASIGDSGNIAFEAANILLKKGSQVLAHADDGHDGGTVTMTAYKAATTDILGYREASASIRIGEATGGATVKGAQIDMLAKTDVQTQFIYDEASLADNAVNFATTAATSVVGFAASLLGANLVHSQAIGTASVLVESGSTLEASGSISLRAENNTSAGAMPDTGISGPGTQVNTPLGLGALYARNKSDASVTIKSGATVEASDLTVRAHNTASLEASVEAADPGGDRNTLSIGVGVINADIDATAVVEAGVVLKVGGDVSVAATNVNTFSNTVAASAGDAGRASVAVAVTEISTSTRAELNASAKDATSIEVLSVNDTTSNITTAESKAGSTLNDAISDAVKEKLKPLTDTAGALEDKIWEKLLGGAEPDAKVKPKSTPFRVGGAVAWVDSNATATASIGDNAALHATDHIVVAARTIGVDTQVGAEASAVSMAKDNATADTARTTFSAGVAIGNYKHEATALIGRNAVLTAPVIGVASDVIIPVRETLITGGSFTKWDGLSTIKDWFDDVTGIFDVFNSFSSAKSTSDNSNGAIALSGSFTLLTFDNNARTEIGEGATLNIAGTRSGSWTHGFEVVADDSATSEDESVAQDWTFDASADVTAKRDVTLLFHGGQFIPGSAGAGSNGKALGMAYTQETVNGTSLVLVREGATIQGIDETAGAADADGLRSWTVNGVRATDAVNIAAEGRGLVLSIASLAGYGSTFGLSGAASVVEVENNTRALVDDEATLRAGALTVSALDAPVVWSIAGGFNKSESAGVGIGIAYNGVTGTVEALVGDNDDEVLVDGTRSSQRSATGLLRAGDITVEARTEGRTEAIAVTGALADSSNSNSSNGGSGFFSNIESKYNELQGKLAKLVELKPSSTSQEGKGSSQGTGSKPSFGLSGAGSGAVNDMTMVTRARLDGANVEQTDGAGAHSLKVMAVSDLDIVTASGAAAITRAGTSQNSSAAIAGSVSVNMIDNTVEAQIDDSRVIDAHDVTVNALAGGEQLSIAIGAAVSTSAKQNSNSASVAGSLSLSFIDNTILAGVSDSVITGAAGASGRALDVTAYNRMFIGTGGGSLTLGGKTGAGGAVTYSDVTNIIDAGITGGSQVSAMDSAAVRAFNATEIGAGAAMGQASTESNGATFGGAVVITEVTNDTTAQISGLSSVNVTGSVNVLAADSGADSTLENIIEPGSKRENTVKGLDYCGRDGAGAGVTTNGNCITSVAGILQASKGANVGLSFNWSAIDNDLTAKIENADVLVSGSAGTLNVRAQSDVAITSLALGVSVSTDKVSGVGSVATSFIDNDLYAGISAPLGNAAFDSVEAANVTIEARDRSRIDTLAGTFAAGKTAAVGASVVYADIGNVAQAAINGSTVRATETIALYGSNDARIRSLAVAGSVAVGNGAPAISASVAVNFIGNETSATVEDALLEDDGDGNDVTVSASDSSQIKSLAGSVAVGASAGAGAAFAYNKIGNVNLASIEDSTVRRADTLSLSASESALIQSLAVSASGGQTVAFSGSVTLNHIGKYDGDTTNGGEGGNSTTAQVVGSTLENSGGDSVVSLGASDSSTIQSLAGSVAFSGNVAIGGAIGDNWVRNTAKARIDDSTIGGATSVDVAGSNSSLIESASASGSGAPTGAFAASASSNRTDNQTIAEMTGSDVSGGTAAVSLTATDTAEISSLAGGAAIGGGASVGAGVAVNKIANTTRATLSGKKTGGLAVTDLLLRADSLATIETLAIGLGGDVTVGVGGSVAVNLIDSDTRAVIENGALVEARDNVGVLAEADDRITLLAGAAGIGLTGAGVGAAVTVNEITGSTEAAIRDSSVAARAQQGPGLTVNSGTIAGVNLKASIDRMNQQGGGYSSSDPFVAPDLVASRNTETVSGIAVNAASSHQTTTAIANVGGGLFAGVAATLSVNIIGGDTQAQVSNSTLNGGSNTAAASNQAVSIKASDHAYGTTFTGTVAIGAVGAGLGADTNVFERTTRASVTGGSVTGKGAADVEAQSSQGIASIVVGAAGGLGGVMGSGSLAKFVSTTEAYSSGAAWQVGALDVNAQHQSQMLVAAGALAVGAVGAAGTFAVGLDTSATTAYVDGGSVDADGQVNVTAGSATEMRTWAIGGTLAGSVGVAGAAAVGLIDSTTSAYVMNTRVGSSGERSGGLKVEATDSVVTESRAGSLAVGGVAGAGAGASVTKIDNTTSATIQDSDVYVAGDVAVNALATRNLSNTAVAAAAGGTLGIGGAAAVTIMGAGLDSDSSAEVNKNGSGTLSKVDTFSNGNRMSTNSSSGNISTNDNLSQADIDRVNARGQVSATSRVGSTPDGATHAAIIDTTGAANTISAGGNVRVKASEKDAADVLAGGLALGGIAGVGAAVSVLNVSHDVKASIEGVITVSAGTGSVEVEALTGDLLSNRQAARVNSYQAAGGLVGVGAAVAKADVDNEVTAHIGRGVTVEAEGTAGGVLVKASDTSSVDAHAEGYAVGLVAAGVVIAQADKSGHVNATIGDINQVLTATSSLNWGGGAFTLQASRSGSVDAFSRAGSGGVYAGSGSGATASDGGFVLARVGRNVTLEGDGALTVLAETSPDVGATAEGYGGALGAYVGVSVAEADASSTVDAAIHASSVTAASLTLTAAHYPKVGQATAEASAEASGGGLLLGASATESTAHTTANVSATLVSGADLDIAGLTRISASSDTRTHASVTGVVAGLLAAGFNDADAGSNSTTRASVENGVTGSAGSKLEVFASGTDNNFAEAESGSGGLLAGAGATADTSTASLTSATLGGGSGTTALDADAMQVKSEHTAVWNGAVDTVQAALAGASGSTSQSTVTSTVEALIAAQARLSTRDLDVLAKNNSRKPWLANGVFNASAGTGGLLSGAAAGSYSEIFNTTRALIDTGALVNVTGDVEDPGRTRLVAINDLELYDRTKLDTGGLVAIAMAESSIVAHNFAEVGLQDGAQLDSVGDVYLGSRIEADIETSANARTYGLAGAAMGTSTTLVDYDNRTFVAANAGIRADGEIYLLAGRDADGVSNSINARARTDLFNKTLAPIIESQLKADAAVALKNRVEVAGNAQVRSVENVNLGAIRGSNVADGQGVGKDLWREAAAAVASFFSNLVGQGDVSLDLHGGTSTVTGEAGVQVDGLVDAGIQNKQRLVIDYTANNPNDIYDESNLDVSEQTEGIEYTISEEDRVASLFDEIDRLTTLRAEYSGDAASEAAYDNEINRIMQQLLDDGLAELQMVSNENGVLVSQLVPLDTAPVKYINVQNVLARGGDINVTGDYLVGGATATLKARKDTEITIDNNSPFYLRTAKLTIADTGGKLTFNGATIDGTTTSQINAGINARNAKGSAGFGTVQTAGSGAAPVIEVRNDYNPSLTNPSYQSPVSYEAPDIQMTGNITNVTGVVKVSNAKGSIIVQGLGNQAAPTILADTIDIAAGKNFVQSYVNGFFNVGGAALAKDQFGNWGGVWKTIAAASEAAAELQPVTTTHYELSDASELSGSGSIIAGNNVFISARYLNINGTVQAGIADWSLTLGTDLDSKIDGFAKEYADLAAAGKKPANARYELTAVDNRNGKIASFYNAETGLVELDGVKVQGGYMQLFGEIINTGGGQLKVVDGYGRVNVTNNTSRALQINGIDTGDDIEGKIRITDTAFRYDSANNTIVTDHSASNFNSLRPVTTEITRIGNDIKFERRASVDDAVTGLAREVSIMPDQEPETVGTGRTTSYSPLTGQRYVYTTGESFEKVDLYYAYSDSAIGFIPSGSGGYTSGPFTTTRANDPLLNGEYVDQAGQSTQYEYDLTRYSTSNSVRASRRSWSECIASSPGVCWERRYWIEDTWVQGKKDFNVHSIKADLPISISFIGWDANSVDAGVNISSKAGIALAGPVRNLDQVTTLTAADGAIESLSDSALISGKTIVLTAGTGIGGDNAPILLNLQDNGSVRAVTAQGDIALKTLAGDLLIDQVSTGMGRVMLDAERNIMQANGALTSARVIGDSIDLSARSGSIGAVGLPLNLQTNAAGDGILDASASGDIVIRHTGSGDVRLQQVASSGGDVYLAAGGNVIDANTNETRDTRAESELLSLWDSLNLVDDGTTTSGAGKSLQDTLDAYKAQRDNDYRSYWSMRNSGNIQNGSYVASSGEVEALTAQNIDVGEFEQRRTDDFKRLDNQFAGTTYDANYSYTITQADIDLLSPGYAWTADQLKTALPASVLFKSTSDTETRIEEANIVGRHISVEAAGGLGRLSGSVDIPVSGTLSDAQRLALASAEPDDISFDAARNVIVVLQRDDVDIAGNGGVAAQSVLINAGTHAYLGSEQDINIDRVQAGQAIRIKGGGGVYEYELRSTALPTISGQSLIIEASAGDIGRALRPLHVDLQGTLTARAGGSMWLHASGGAMDPAGDLRLAEIFAHDDITLSADGSIVDERGSGRLVAIQSSAGAVNLTAGDDIGADGNPLRMSVAETVTAQAGGDVHLGTHTSLPAPGLDADLRLAGIDAGGDVSLDAPLGDVAIDGDIHAGGRVDITVDGALTQAVTDIDAAHDIAISADSYVMADGATLRSADGAIDIAAVGDVVVGRIEATGNADDAAIRIRTAGRLIDGGDLGGPDLIATTAGAGVVLEAAGGIGGVRWNNGTPIATPDALETDIGRLDAASTSGGITLDNAGDLQIGTLAAQLDVAIVNGGDLSATDIASSAGSISLDNAGDLQIGTVAARLDVAIDNGGSLAGTRIASSAGSVTVAAGQDLSVDEIEAAQHIEANSGGAVSGNAWQARAGDARVAAEQSVVIGTLGAGQDIDVLARQGNADGTRWVAANNLSITAGGGVTVSEAEASAQNATILAVDDILMDSVTAGAGIILESSNGSVSVSRIVGDILSLSAKKDLNLGTLSVGRSLFFNSESVTAHILHTRSDAPLAMRATGRNGAPARWVDLQIDSAVGVRFDRVEALDARLAMDRGYMRIDKGYIANRADFYNPVTHVYMDNQTTVVRPADVQLHHVGGTFNNTLLDGWKLVTDPYVVMRDPLHEVVMNTVLDFSGREQSRELIVTRIETPDKQSAAGQVPQVQPLAINLPLDFPAVNSGDEETEEEAEARRRLESEEEEAQ